MIIPKNKIHVLKAALSDKLFRPKLETALSEKDQEMLSRLIDQCTLVECGEETTGLYINTMYKTYSDE